MKRTNPEEHTNKQLIKSKLVLPEESVQEGASCPTACDLKAGGQEQHEPVASSSSDSIPDQSMALSVTRHAQISPEPEWKLLACGIDTLDLSFYVVWNDDWDDLLTIFDGRKELAQGCNGISIDDKTVRPHIFLPTSRHPNFRYKLKFPEYILDIGISKKYRRASPNAYASITSEALWLLGIDEAVKCIKKDIEAFGGTIETIKPSRCDLCVDFRIPGGLSFDFIKKHKVSRCTKLRPFMDGDFLETMYIGSKQADIQVRFYDKGKEIENSNRREPFAKARYMHVWNTDDLTDVWRIEFQIRRPTLKQFHIDTLEDLKTNVSSLFKYLTTEWFSLRIPDNENQSRRTVHPGWKKVQNCGVLFGSYQDDFNRAYRTGRNGSLDWYIQRIARYVLNCCVILGNENLWSVFTTVTTLVMEYWQNKNFHEEYMKVSVQRGVTSNIIWKSEGVKRIQEALDSGTPKA